MEYLQYLWSMHELNLLAKVLNLIINGIPSILADSEKELYRGLGFKPYYKWNTFNT